MPIIMTLGIMTLYNDKKRLEERGYFKQLTKIGEDMGMDVYVFTPSDVNEAKKRIYTHYYDTKAKQWKRRWRPFPTCIFDRCRYQANARFKQLRRFRAKHPNLKYLNRPLANKWKIHQLLSRNTRLRPHLPTTRRYSGYEDVLHMLASNSAVFLKPINGTGGRGILKIRKHGSLYHLQGRDRQRKIMTTHSVSEAKLAAKVRGWHVNKSFLIQKGIDITLNDGRVHDYRLLMQKNRSGEWEVAGCAGRIGAKHSITSNLHGGGKAVSMKSLLKKWFPDESAARSIQQNVYAFGHSVVSEIEKKYGKQMCELALDIAIDRSRRIWLLEINPKPSREVFAKIGESNVYEKALKRPLEYALWLSER